MPDNNTTYRAIVAGKVVATATVRPGENHDQAWNYVHAMFDLNRAQK